MNEPLLNIPLDDTVVRPSSHGPARRLLKYLDDGIFALQIDNSSLEVFTACPRSAQYKLINAREASGGAALTYGSAIHNGLESWYTDRSHGVKSMEQTIEDMLMACVNTFIDPVGFDEWRTPDSACDTLMRYVNHYPTEAFDIRIQDNMPCVEQSFSLPLGVLEYPNVEIAHSYHELVDLKTLPPSIDPHSLVTIREIHVYWTGKMDVIVRMDNANWVIDHKTTSMGGPTFFEDFTLSNQTVGYCWAGQQSYGEPFAGLLVNALIGRKPTRTGKSLELVRQRFYYRQDQLTEWHHNTLCLVSDFMSNLVRNYFPLATKWCMGKYGKCKYHDVCSLPAASRLALLNSDQYTDVTWTPLKNENQV